MYFRTTTSFHTGYRPATRTENDPEMGRNLLNISVYPPHPHNARYVNGNPFLAVSRACIIFLFHRLFGAGTQVASLPVFLRQHVATPRHSVFTLGHTVAPPRHNDFALAHGFATPRNNVFALAHTVAPPRPPIKPLKSLMSLLPLPPQNPHY